MVQPSNRHGEKAPRAFHSCFAPKLRKPQDMGVSAAAAVVNVSGSDRTRLRQMRRVVRQNIFLPAAVIETYRKWGGCSGTAACVAKEQILNQEPLLAGLANYQTLRTIFKKSLAETAVPFVNYHYNYSNCGLTADASVSPCHFPAAHRTNL
jgi:hypothetical protein